MFTHSPYGIWTYQILVGQIVFNVRRHSVEHVGRGEKMDSDGTLPLFPGTTYTPASAVIIHVLRILDCLFSFMPSSVNS